MRSVTAPFALGAVLALAAGPACGRREPAPPSLSGPTPHASANATGSASAESPEPPPPRVPTLVDLRGKLAPAPAVAQGAPRLASISMLTYSRARPLPTAPRV